MAEENKKSQSLKELKEQIKDILSGVNVDNDLESEAAIKMLDELETDESFNQEIENILACFDEQALDLTKLQAQIMIIIKKYLGKINSKKLPINIDERLIAKNMKYISL